MNIKLTDEQRPVARRAAMQPYGLVYEKIRITDCRPHNDKNLLDVYDAGRLEWITIVNIRHTELAEYVMRSLFAQCECFIGLGPREPIPIFDEVQSQEIYELENNVKVIDLPQRGKTYLHENAGLHLFDPPADVEFDELTLGRILSISTITDEDKNNTIILKIKDNSSHNVYHVKPNIADTTLYETLHRLVTVGTNRVHDVYYAFKLPKTENNSTAKTTTGHTDVVYTSPKEAVSNLYYIGSYFMGTECSSEGNIDLQNIDGLIHREVYKVFADGTVLLQSGEYIKGTRAAMGRLLARTTEPTELRLWVTCLEKE